jgi:hypothetical protein
LKKLPFNNEVLVAIDGGEYEIDWIYSATTPLIILKE